MTDVLADRPQRRPAIVAYEEAREALARFLDRPTSLGFDRLRTAMGEHLAVERDRLVEADDDPTLAARAERCVELAKSLNALAWVKPGSDQMRQELQNLRHVFLQARP